MDINQFKVPVDSLRWICQPEKFKFDCTADIAPLSEFIGQDRAIRSVDFGLGVDRPGYNIFVTGLTGTGKASVIKAHLEKITQEREAAGIAYPVFDWCYVFNLTDPDRPRHLKLPRGAGKKLREQMGQLLADLKMEIPKAFAAEQYAAQRKEIVEEGRGKSQKLFQQLEKEASKAGFSLQASPYGMIVIPVIQGHPVTQEEFAALAEKQRHHLETAQARLMERVQETVQKAHQVEKVTGEKVRELDQKVGEAAVSRHFQEVIRQYQDQPEVLQYVEEVKAYTLKNISAFQEEKAERLATPPAVFEREARDPFLPFQVNVFVDNSQNSGPPIIIENHPTYGNLFGKIERRAMLGAYFTDHTMLKAGTISQANGGYLLVNARDVLLAPLAWDALKRVIKTKELRVEDPYEQFGFIPQGIKPQPIPTELKVIMTGDYMLYQLLSLYDEDFWEIFKVKADFDFQIDKTDQHIDDYAAFICGICEKEKICHFDRSGVAKVVEFAARQVADQKKLSTRFGQIKDILVESAYWAKKAGKNLVAGEHVRKAIEEKVYRSNRMAERLKELIAEGTLMVDTEGAVVGQVNGLSVYDLGDISFGRPSRITVKTFMGRRGVINIERESQLSGPIHNKGVLILSGYLGYKYAQDKPLTLGCSICFEQSYEGVEGDSASSTELYAILSSLSDVPIKQNIAITGSVNQKGELQPIGGVNQKIEGFFEVCRAKGLTGEQGVLIPHQNVRNLMLREDVVEAVKKGRFHIYAALTIDEGIAILTGVETGERRDGGTYPRGTINYLVDKRLKELAKGLKGYFPEVVAPSET